MTLSAGEFKHRITIIYTKDGGTDEQGYALEPQEVKKRVWAKAIPVSGQDYLEAKANQTENITRFVIRYRRYFEVNTDMQIEFRGITYEIDGPPINDGFRNETLTIIGKAVS